MLYVLFEGTSFCACVVTCILGRALRALQSGRVAETLPKATCLERVLRLLCCCFGVYGLLRVSVSCSCRKLYAPDNSRLAVGLRVSG